MEIMEEVVMLNVLSYGFNFDRLDTVPSEHVGGACFFSFTRQGMTQERSCLLLLIKHPIQSLKTSPYDCP